MSTPLNNMKERFETKEKLVEAVEKLMTDELWLPRLSADRGGDKGLAHVSNKKLLRLHRVLTKVKTDFGSRAKLVTAILEAEGRTKDADYEKRLGRESAPRLYDRYQAATRRARARAS